MQSIYHAQELAENLKGSTCLVSRKRLKPHIICNYPFYTLHRISARVLQKTSNPSYYIDRLAGEEMYRNVRYALTNNLGRIPTEAEVKDSYYQIRNHKNCALNMNTAVNGTQILSQYQKVSGEGMDWEESLQNATWFLNNNYISSLYKFHYQNIILVQPELLEKACNKNAFDLFMAWCKWMPKHTLSKIYVVKNEGMVWQYENNQFNIYNTKSSSQSKMAAAF
jgi:hypothetical protein